MTVVLVLLSAHVFSQLMQEKNIVLDGMKGGPVTGLDLRRAS